MDHVTSRDGTRVAYRRVGLTRRFPRAEAFSELSVPVLVLAGERTWPLLAASSTAIADALPNAEHRTIDGGDHAFDVPSGAAAIRELLRVA